MEEMNENERKLLELKEKRVTIGKHGGDKRVETQHEKGKLTARERIALLMDEGSFVEYDDFMKTRSVYYGLDKMELPADGVLRIKPLRALASLRYDEKSEKKSR